MTPYSDRYTTYIIYLVNIILYILCFGIGGKSRTVAVMLVSSISVNSRLLILTGAVLHA